MMRLKKMLHFIQNDSARGEDQYDVHVSDEMNDDRQAASDIPGTHGRGTGRGFSDVRLWWTPYPSITKPVREWDQKVGWYHAGVERVDIGAALRKVGVTDASWQDVRDFEYMLATGLRREIEKEYQIDLSQRTLKEQWFFFQYAKKTLYKLGSV
jgi:hypothetical protein